MTSYSTYHMIEWQLSCPYCNQLLSTIPGVYYCTKCGRQFPLTNGVVRFLEKTDKFYENRYPPDTNKFSPDERTLWGKILLYLVSMHYFWYVNKYIPKGSKIMDLAGGGGMVFLTKGWHTIGLEVATHSVNNMATVYELALQANALKIPLADKTLDAVVSRFFFEHITLPLKSKLLAECFRVLKPGGWFITLQDCECNNWLWRWAKRDKAMFQKQFIENDGHYGLAYASENLHLLRDAGFKVHKYYAYNKTPFVSLSMLECMQPYRSKSYMASLLLHMASWIYRNRLLNTIYTFGLTILDDFVERILPLDRARYLLTICRSSEKR